MRKGWKIFWAICGAVTGIGILMCVIAFGMGVSFSDFENYGLLRFRSNISNTKYAEEGTYTYSNVHDLDIEVEAVKLQISKYSGDTLKVEAVDVDKRLKFTCRQDEDGAVEIHTNGRNLLGMNGGSYGTIYVYVPTGMTFDEASLSVAAGEMQVDDLSTQSLDIEIGAGKGVINHYSANEVDAQCGAGSLTMNGTFEGTADIECGVGKLDFTVSGREADYNYDLECGIGEILIGNESYSGIAREKRIDNGQMKSMDINCDVGSVQVTFGE